MGVNAWVLSAALALPPGEPPELWAADVFQFTRDQCYDAVDFYHERSEYHALRACLYSRLRYGEQCKQVSREAGRREGLWLTLALAKTPHNFEDCRRQHLATLRLLLGDDAFSRGEMPPP